MGVAAASSRELQAILLAVLRVQVPAAGLGWCLDATGKRRRCLLLRWSCAAPSLPRARPVRRTCIAGWAFAGATSLAVRGVRAAMHSRHECAKRSLIAIFFCFWMAALFQLALAYCVARLYVAVLAAATRPLLRTAARLLGVALARQLPLHRTLCASAAACRSRRSWGRFVGRRRGGLST